MLDRLKEIRHKALQELSKINDITELESWRVRYLGKKSELVQTLRSEGCPVPGSVRSVTELVAAISGLDGEE